LLIFSFYIFLDIFICIVILILTGTSAFASGPEVEAGDYRVRLSTSGFVISYRDKIISQGSELDIVEGPGWKKTLVGKGFFNNVIKLKKWKVDGSKLIVNHKQNGITVNIGAETYPDRVTLFVKYNSGGIPLKASSWWIMALPEDTNAQCFFERKGGKKNAENYEP